MTIEELTRTRVLAITAVSAIASTRVWIEKLPEHPVYPCVRVALVSDVVGQHLRGPDGLQVARVQLDACARDGDVYSAAAELEAAIYGNGLGASASGLFGWVGLLGSPAVEFKNVSAGPRLVRFDPEEKRVLTMTRDYFIRYQE